MDKPMVRPQAITPPYKIPKFKHVMLVNAKLLHGFFVGGYRYKVLSDMLFIAAPFYKPFSSG